MVVILGDQHSAMDADGVWVDKVAGALDWAPVVNLSSAGRGYLSKPASCDLKVCANFEGTIAAAVAEKPDVVVTFGGWEDGDYDLTDASTKYFAALRKALPDAQLVAISPVTSQDQAEYFLQLHSKTIRTAVEAVGGTFIDVGQPGVGDGDQLSAAAQEDVAEAIIAKLS